MKRSALYLAIGLCLGVAVSAAALKAHTFIPHRPGQTADWVKRMKVEDYGRQQVIYHVDQTAGVLNGHFRHILQIAQNHVDAVGADKLDLRIILQTATTILSGDGIEGHPTDDPLAVPSGDSPGSSGDGRPDSGDGAK